MKKFLTIIFIFAATAVFAQDQFAIKLGVGPFLPSSKTWFRHNTGKHKVDIDYAVLYELSAYYYPSKYAGLALTGGSHKTATSHKLSLSVFYVEPKLSLRTGNTESLRGFVNVGPSFNSVSSSGKNRTLKKSASNPNIGFVAEVGADYVTRSDFTFGLMYKYSSITEKYKHNGHKKSYDVGGNGIVFSVGYVF